jgi:hypothetical protein
MFAMKRVILAAAFIVAMSGFAAAQSTSAKSTSTPPSKTTAKKQDSKTGSKSTVLKHETASDAKADSNFRVVLPPPTASDTTAMPAVKKSDDFN